MRAPHPDVDAKFKCGKLKCVCGENWGNIQNNVHVAPFKGKEVALLKFDNIRCGFTIAATKRG